MQRIYIFIIVLLHLTIANAQNSRQIDSLETITKTSNNDSIIMDAYNKLRRATYYANPKQSKIYTEKFLEYAKKQKDSFHVALASFYLGNSHVVESNFETAIQYYFKSADYFELKQDSARLSSVLNGIGAAYENSGNDSLSLKYFKKSQEISKSIGDLRRSAIALNNIGNIYKYRNDLQNAKRYMEQAVEDIQTTDQQQYIMPLMTNLANTYADLHEFDKSTRLYENVVSTVDTINDVFSYASALRGLGNAAMTKGESGEWPKIPTPCLLQI